MLNQAFQNKDFNQSFMCLSNVQYYTKYYKPILALRIIQHEWREEREKEMPGLIQQ